MCTHICHIARMNHMSMSILKFKAVETCGAPLPFKGAANFAGNVAWPPCVTPPSVRKGRGAEKDGLAARPMPSASSTDTRTLVAEIERQLHQYRAEHVQLEASMRWRLERELEASRAGHEALVARMTSSIAKLERAAVTGKASCIAGLEPAAATPTGATAPIDQAPASSQPAQRAAVPSLPRPTALPATADANLPVDWMPQSPICCLLPDDMLERIAKELQSGVVWQTCAFLRHRRLNSIEALVLSSCKLQTLEIPIGGSRDALVLRLWHQLNAGRAILKQLRSAVAEVAIAADQDCNNSRYVCYPDPWKSWLAAIDLIYTGDDVHGRGLNQLAPEVKQCFADDLPALLRDERGGPRASSCENGGVKQVFFEHLRKRIYDFLESQARPHRARLLIQAAEDLIDPRIEAALADRRAERGAEMMMTVLKGFVICDGYLLSERQKKTCSLIVNSPTIGEGARECAIELLQENATRKFQRPRETASCDYRSTRGRLK
jgi:hypothetical protein